MNLEYNQQLLSLRGEVELMREGLPKTENNSICISKTEQYIELTKKIITQLAAFTSQGIENISEVLNKHDTDAEAILSNAEEKKDFNEVKTEFEKTKIEIKQIENKIDSDLYIIQDNLKKALLFSKENENTPEKNKEAIQKIKRVQSSYEMNKKSSRDQIKAITDKVNNIELKIAIINKQHGDVVETEEKTIKISVFDSPELSNSENP